MELWSPPHDKPHLFEWWRPLLLASQWARRRRVPWPINLDEFRLAGRVVRSGRPDVWIYEHHANGGALCVDAIGTTYKFIATPRAKGVGRFRPCDIRSAVWRAGLPEVVEPMWYEDPPRAPASWGAWDGGGGRPGAPGRGAVGEGDDPDDPHGSDTGDDVELREVSGGGAVGHRAVRRHHLTVIDGGGPPGA
jgi:hypothetical protein